MKNGQDTIVEDVVMLTIYTFVDATEYVHLNASQNVVVVVAPDQTKLRIGIPTSRRPRHIAQAKYGDGEPPDDTASLEGCLHVILTQQKSPLLDVAVVIVPRELMITSPDRSSVWGREWRGERWKKCKRIEYAEGYAPLGEVI